MASITQTTERRRKIRRKATGKLKKAQRAKSGTPPFPIQPEQAGPESAEKRKA